MPEPIKVEVAATGKASVDAVTASLTALDAKLTKIAVSASKTGEASKALEAELRKIQKAETGRANSVTGLTSNIDALHAEISKLGKVGGATALKREFDSLKKEINSFDNVGFKSIDQINNFRAKLDQALGRVGAVLGNKKGLTQGQFDIFLDISKAVDASGRKVLGKVTTESEAIEKTIAAMGKRQAAATQKAGIEKAKAEIEAADAQVTAIVAARAKVNQALQKGSTYSVLGGANQGFVKGAPDNKPKMTLDDVRYTFGMPDRSQMKSFAAQLKAQMSEDLATSKLRTASATSMNLDETRKLLGMPDRSQMKSFAAQLKAQMSEALSTEKLRAKSATPMNLDETRALLGLPDRSQMKTFAAELQADMQRIQSMRERILKATSLQQLTTPKGGPVVGSYSVLGGANEGALRMNKELAAAHAANNNHMKEGARHAGVFGSAIKQLTVHHQDLNSSLRGLAQGFGVISAGLSNMVPLVASFAVASAFVKTLKVGAEFEQSMFTISELAGVATSEMSNLRQKVLDLGASTQYGPLELADGLKILTLAGLGAKDAIQALLPTMRFSAAGDIPMQKAAETLVAVGTAYRISAQNFSVVADTIAKTAADTMASVDSMAESFRTASVVAQQYGVSLDDTAAALGALAQIGIKGSAAGTSFRNMITELNKGSGKAAEGVKALGAEIQNVDGSMRSIVEVMRDLSKGLITRTGAAQQGLIQDISNERGGKALAAFQAEALKLINTQNPKLQEQVDILFKQGKALEANTLLVKAVDKAYDEMARKREQAENDSAGFTFYASLEAGLTPLAQYKGLLASLQTDFVKAFGNSEDAVYLLGVRLREVFNSPEFQQGLNSLVSGLVTVSSGMVTATKWVVEHQEAVVALGVAYLALSTVAVRAIAMGALTTVFANLAAGALAVTVALRGVATFAGLALAAKTALAGGLTAVVAGFSGAWTAVVAFGAALAGITAPIWAVIGVVAALAAGVGYLAYKWATAADSAEESVRKQREATIKSLSTSTAADLSRLQSTENSVEKEIDERRRIVQAMWSGVTEDEARTKVHHELTVQRINDTYAEISAIYALQQQKDREAATGSSVERIRAISEINRTELAGLAAIDQAKVRAIQRTKDNFSVIQALAKEQKALADAAAKKAGEMLYGVNPAGGSKGGKPDFAKLKADKAEHDTAKGLIAEIKKEQQAAAKEIARYKAEAAQQTAAAAREEKREIAEVTAAYLDGVEQRRLAALEMDSAVAEGSKSEVAGKNLLASLKLESNRAELAQIQAIASASLKRYAEEFRAATVAHNLEKSRLEKSLSLQKQLAEQLKKKHGTDPSYAREIADAVGQVEVLQEQLKLWEVTTKEIDAASEKLLDTVNKGTADYTAKLREQNKALDDQLLASKRNIKSLQDEYDNRAKGSAELRQEAAIKQAQHAFDLQAAADRLRMAGSESAVQAQKQADIARTDAAYVQLGIAKDAAMSTDWYSATQKALKDYASSLENVAGEIANIFTKSFKGLEDVLTDFLTKGKADFKGFVSSILADMVRLVIRQNIIAPMVNGFISGMAGGGGGAAGGGGSMLGSLAGGAASSMMGGGSGSGLMSGVGNAVTGWFGAGGGAAMSGASAAALSGAGTSLTGTAFTTLAADSAAAYGFAGTSSGMAAGGSVAGGLTAALTAIPVWGWAILAAMAIAAMVSNGETRTGGQYAYSTDGTTAYNARRDTTVAASGVGATFLEGPSGGTGNVGAENLINGAFKGINEILKAVGSSETVTGFQAGYESSENNRGGVFAGGKLASGKTFGESGVGDNYAGTLYETTSSQNLGIEDVTKTFITDLKQATLQALQATTDLPKIIAAKLSGVDVEALSDAAADTLMGEIQNIIASVNSFRDTLDLLPFEGLRDMSFEAAAGLIEAVGGLQNLGNFSANLSSYFENFYSEAEKRQNSVKNITRTLNTAGLGVTEDQVNSATKDTFREIVEQYSAMGESGRDVYLALLSVNQAFSDLNATAEATGGYLDNLKTYTASYSTKGELRATSVKEITDKLNKNTSGLKVTESMVSSANIKDFRAAVEATKAMGPAGRSAYEALLSVNQQFLELGNTQQQIDALVNTYGDLEGAAAELDAPAEKLVDSWRKNKSAIQDLNDALDEALGTIKATSAAEKAVADVKKAVVDRDELKAARKSIGDTIDSIRLAAAKPADKVTLLKGKEASLREEFAANPTAALFNKLTETTLARIRAEGELRRLNLSAEESAQARIDSLRRTSLQEQLSGMEALRDSAAELKQFVSDLKTGDLSALSPRDRLAEAKSNFESTLRRAKAGDINAVNNLQGSASNYLGVAKTNFGSATSQYAGIFKDVTDNVSQLADFATKSPTGDSAIDLQIEEYRKQMGLLAETAVDTSEAEIAALEELGLLADGAIGKMDKNIVALELAAREQIALLQAVVDAQEVELRVQIAAHKELVDILERIDTNTDDTAATAAREAAKV